MAIVKLKALRFVFSFSLLSYTWLLLSPVNSRGVMVFEETESALPEIVKFHYLISGIIQGYDHYTPFFIYLKFAI